MSEHAQGDVHGHEHGRLPHPATLSQFAHYYRSTELKFSFKKQKVDPKTGAVIDPATATEEVLKEAVKRPPVTVTVPMPTFEGIVKVIEDSTDAEGNSKVADYLIELVEEAIKDQVREQLSDDKNPVNRQEDLDLSKLTLLYIANLPKAERTGGGISKDTWADWEKDYIEVMTPIRDEERATKAAKLFTSRYNPVKSDKVVLKFLREQLQIWASKSTLADDFADVYAYLDQRATDLMNKDSQELLAAL